MQLVNKTYMVNKWVKIIKILLVMIQTKYKTTLYFGHDVALIISKYLIEYNKRYNYLSKAINESHFENKYHKILYFKIPKISYIKYIYDHPFILTKIDYFDADYIIAAINKSPSMIQYIDYNNNVSNGIIMYVLKRNPRLDRLVPSHLLPNIPFEKYINNTNDITNITDIIDYYGFDKLNDDQIVSMIKRNPKLIHYMNGINGPYMNLVLNKFDDNNLIDLIKKWSYVMQYINDDRQTTEICTLAIKCNPFCLRYICNQTWTLCDLAITLDPLSFVHIKYKTYDLCLKAIQLNGLNIQYVDNQFDELSFLAVVQNGLALKYIKNKTDTICYKAIQQNEDAIKYFDKIDKIGLEIAQIYQPDLKYYKLRTCGEEKLRMDSRR